MVGLYIRSPTVSGKEQLLWDRRKSPIFSPRVAQSLLRTAMMDLSYVALPHRKLIEVGGEDPRTFLQGLVSADVLKATANRAVYGAFLTPQGRFLHEFFLAEGPKGLLLETDAEGRDAFLQRLGRYNLRRKITIKAFDAWQPYALFGEGAASAAAVIQEGVVVTDPRLSAAGLRGVVARKRRDDTRKRRVSGCRFRRLGSLSYRIGLARRGARSGARQNHPVGGRL